MRRGYTRQAGCGTRDAIAASARTPDRKGRRIHVDENDHGSRAGFDTQFTQRNPMTMTVNCRHLATMLRAGGGIPNRGNDRNAWEAGERFGFENPSRTIGS